jgi:hypothetical protein
MYTAGGTYRDRVLLDKMCIRMVRSPAAAGPVLYCIVSSICLVSSLCLASGRALLGGCQCLLGVCQYVCSFSVSPRTHSTRAHAFTRPRQGRYKRGDVCLLKSPSHPDQVIVKRLVGSCLRALEMRVQSSVRECCARTHAYCVYVRMPTCVLCMPTCVLCIHAYAYMRVAYTCVCLHAVAHSPCIQLCVLGKGSLQVHECRYAHTHTHTHTDSTLALMYIYTQKSACRLPWRGDTSDTTKSVGGATQLKDTTKSEKHCARQTLKSKS